MGCIELCQELVMLIACRMIQSTPLFRIEIID